MKLSIMSSQSKEMMDGVTFAVTKKVTLTPEEEQLMRHYKLEEEVLLKKKMKTANRQ